MRVLVVDDSKISRELIMMHLRSIGIENIDTAEDGVDAIGKITKLPKNTKYDVIMLDVVMPRKNGLATLKDIKQLTPESKIIICSSLHDSQTVKIALGFGVNGYIIKPFTKEKLLEAFWYSLKIHSEV
ncbi:Chemotaxis protein CheY [Sporomusa carbonis]|uniref:response regulator n=1 Tax=Sporomusa carbonis TaxID=3076075 RepID=UPI003A6D7398